MSLGNLIAGGVYIDNAADKMPRHASKRFGTRRDSIRRIYVHHSGRLGKPGLEGAIASARYSVTRKTNTQPNGWPGPAYHLWIPYEKFIVDDMYTIIRMNRDFTRCWHTGGPANDHGIGVVLQGNTTKRPMSDFQIECLEALLPYLKSVHHLPDHDWLAWHSIADQYGGKRKPTCPGRHAQQWLENYVNAA